MNAVIKLACMGSLAFVISACGSGGGSAAANTATTPSTPAPVIVMPVVPTPDPLPQPAPAMVDYSPAPVLLNSPAATTSELYVAERFTFEQSQRITLDLSVRNADESVAAFTKIFVYGMAAEVETLTDEALLGASLLLTATTDEQGRVVQIVECPVDVKAVALKVAVMGIDAQALVSIENQQVVYSFK